MLTDISVAIDLEATGMDPVRDEIIEIGAVKFRGDTVIDRFQTLIRPRGNVSLAIKRLTGITPQDLQDAPRLPAVLPRLRDFIRTAPLIGQSISFDLDMLQAAGMVITNQSFDTFELATVLLPELTSYSLVNIATSLGVSIDGQHRAVSDAETTMRVFNALYARADTFDDATLERLVEMTRGNREALSRFFASLLRQRQADGELAGGATIGAQFLTQLSASMQTGPEAQFLLPRDRPQRLESTLSERPIDYDDLDAALAPGGPFASVMPGFEVRPQQLDVMHRVAQALNEGGQLLVEAGTGTGKSLGYLLPAALHALERGERVVISTATIALQDQLIRKDVPALLAAAEAADPNGPNASLAALRDLRVSVLKGRANYLCLRRWFVAQREAPRTSEQAQLHAKVVAWLQQTETGDAAELHLSPEQRGYWSALAEDEGACVPSQCIFHRRNQCFLFRARHRAEEAHLIIVNHSLLLSDLMARHNVIPPYQHLIIDEAHHLEAEATQQVGYSVTRTQVADLVRRVIHEQAPVGIAGALGSAASLLMSLPGNSARAAAADLQAHLLPAHERARLADDLTTRLFTLLREVAANDGENSGYDRQLRITPTLRRDPTWHGVELLWDELLTTLIPLGDDVRHARRLLDRLSIDEVPAVADLQVELDGVAQDIEEMRDRLNGLLSQPTNDMVYWLATRQQSGETSVSAAPLYVGDLLADQLFSRCESVTLTSATMTVDGTFDYVRDRLGLPDADELQSPSPFDYRNSVLLAVANDVPQPGDPGHQRKLQDSLVDICRASGGRAMVLFTSHSALQATYRAIRRPLEEYGIVVLGQRIDGSPRQLVDRLRANPATVILGTNSFWEGVDVVGSALSMLIICKLPFPVPSDPVFAARSELFDDPFNQYAVPQAVLRFKQGFGRLIRSASDRGVCVVLDRRVHSRRYGETFVASLPECEYFTGTSGEIAVQTQMFLDPAVQLARAQMNAPSLSHADDLNDSWMQEARQTGRKDAHR